MSFFFNYMFLMLTMNSVEDTNKIKKKNGFWIV